MSQDIMISKLFQIQILHSELTCSLTMNLKKLNLNLNFRGKPEITEKFPPKISFGSRRIFLAEDSTEFPSSVGNFRDGKLPEFRFPDYLYW